MKILTKPKFATSLALILALIIGVFYTIEQNRTRSKEFTEISLLTPGVGVNTDTNSKDLTLAFPVGGRIKSVSVKVGDKVKAGEVLASLDSLNALGAINQAKAAYDSAKNAYDKLVNGASTPDIDVAKVALNNAKNNYDTVVSTQKVLVSNALSAMLNSSLVAIPTVSGVSVSAPIISGIYTGTETGVYTISTYQSGNGGYFSISGLENSSGPVNNIPNALGSKGLFIQFPTNFSSTNVTWTVSIPNTQASNYLANYNAYQIALQNQSQIVAGAKGLVDSAQANLDQKLANARIEDIQIAKAQVGSTQGALQVAQGVYNNTIITAPVDGTITNISITAGQVATANTPAIVLSVK